MIDQNKVTEAIREFTAQPDWNAVFTQAPAGAMERLAISFYFSKNKDTFTSADFDEYRNLREELERSLTAEDLDYLVSVTEKPETLKHYKKLQERLQNAGGQPTGGLAMQFGGEGSQGAEQGGAGENMAPMV